MWREAEGNVGAGKGGAGGAFSRNRALTLGTGGRGAYIVNCTLIIWILPSGALFYDQNVQNAVFASLLVFLHFL